MQFWISKILWGDAKLQLFSRTSKHLVRGRFSSAMLNAGSFEESLKFLTDFLQFHVLKRPVQTVRMVFDSNEFKIDSDTWNKLKNHKTTKGVSLDQTLPPTDIIHRSYVLPLRSDYNGQVLLANIYIDSPTKTQQQRLRLIQDQNTLDELGGFLFDLYINR